MASAHYDTHADPTAARRGQSTKLRRFHNDAKRALLEMFAPSGSGRLLDLACGRGGDIHKWIALGLSEVHAVDISAKSIEEARSRYANARTKTSTSGQPFTFEVCDVSQGVSFRTPKNVVTCFFAMHYFWKSEEMAHAFMKSAASNLVPGGHFIGIVPSGRSVLDHLQTSSVYEDECMRIEACWLGKPACFSSAYKLQIQGTVVEDSDVLEYLVFSNVLEKVAGVHGLVPVPLDHRFFESPKIGCLHKLRPPFVDQHAPVSKLFSAFAFKKIN
jgi:mRNA (guanine-N7-)-methyltransferase